MSQRGDRGGGVSSGQPPLSFNRSFRKPGNGHAAGMDFSFKDGKKLWSLVWRQETLVEKKRRWLESMIPRSDGCSRRVKRPKFLNDVYLAESDIRRDEVSCEKVRAHVERSFSLQCDDCNRHFVREGFQLFDLQKGKDDSLSAESLKIMYSTISKLSNEALQSVANIASHNKFSFEKTRPIMKRIIEAYLPNYLANLNKENNMSQLSQILRNPCSYQSDYVVSLVTLVSPSLLSSINQTLNGLDEMPMQALVAMNRKLREKSCTPKFSHVARASKRGLLVKLVKKRCENIISKLKEGDDLPKTLAKAISVMNLFRKQKLRCTDISQSEFFPFSKETVSLQNDVLHALWSLSRVKPDELKLVRPILDPDSSVPFMNFRGALRRYLVECLFECDKGLPDEALQTVALINCSRRRQVMLTDERKEMEVEAVLNLSSHLKALAYCSLHGLGMEECSSDDDFASFGSGNCTEDNDFVLSGTNYFFNSDYEQRQMDGPCCSNNVANTSGMSGFCSTEATGGSHHVPEAEGSASRSKEFLRKPCERTEGFGEAGHYNERKAAGTMTDPYLEKVDDVSHVKNRGYSEVDLYEICDETATVAHRLIGHMLDKFLLVENNEVDEFTRCYLEGGSVPQGPQGSRALLNVEENRNGDILVHAVEALLPALPKSCIDRVKRIMS